MTVWLCQWKMMETEWVLPGASRPVVFQGEHLTQCTLDTQVAEVVTSHPYIHQKTQCAVNVGGWGEVGGAGGGCKLYNNHQQQQCYLIFISAEPGIDWPASPGHTRAAWWQWGKKRRMACLHNEGEFFQLGSKKSELIRKVFTGWHLGVRSED